MSQIQFDGAVSGTWPAVAGAALHAAFGVLRVTGAALRGE